MQSDLRFNFINHFESKGYMPESETIVKKAVTTSENI